MDGGGRYPGSLNVAGLGGAAVASFPSCAAGPGPFSLGRFLPTLLRRRRSSVAVPFGRRLPRHLGTVLTLAVFGAVGLAGCVAGGQYEAFVAANGRPLHLVGRALGLGLDRVTLSGIAQLREGEVLGAAGLDSRTSLAFVSVTEVRERLQALPLVGSVSVRKIYPHELVVELVEREPNALWQRDGALAVVAGDGTVIDGLRDARFVNLPLVVGEGANLRTREYLSLLEAAGPLRGRIRAGTLVSGRRWTLKVDGVDVRLPEQGAAAAMARLVKLQSENRILERDIIAIDLRLPDRVVVRLTEEAAAARLDAVKKRNTKGKGIET